MKNYIQKVTGRNALSSTSYWTKRVIVTKLLEETRYRQQILETAKHRGNAVFARAVWLTGRSSAYQFVTWV
jgi:hypothetical protein